MNKFVKAIEAERFSSCLVGVGFCTADVNMDRLPGWEPQSYGYHGDDGNAFRSDGKGRRYGPTFGTGMPMTHLGCEHNALSSMPATNMMRR